MKEFSTWPQFRHLYIKALTTPSQSFSVIGDGGIKKLPSDWTQYSEIKDDNITVMPNPNGYQSDKGKENTLASVSLPYLEMEVRWG